MNSFFRQFYFKNPTCSRTQLLPWLCRQKNSTYVSRFVGERSLTGKFFAFSAIKNLRRALNSDSTKIVGSNALDIKLRLKNKISFIFEFLYFCKFIFEKNTLYIILIHSEALTKVCFIILIRSHWQGSASESRRNRFVWVFNNADNDGTSIINQILHQQKYLPQIEWSDWWTYQTGRDCNLVNVFIKKFRKYLATDSYPPYSL